MLHFVFQSVGSASALRVVVVVVVVGTRDKLHTANSDILRTENGPDKTLIESLNKFPTSKHRLDRYM